MVYRPGRLSPRVTSRLNSIGGRGSGSDPDGRSPDFIPVGNPFRVGPVPSTLSPSGSTSCRGGVRYETDRPVTLSSVQVKTSVGRCPS